MNANDKRNTIINWLTANGFSVLDGPSTLTYVRRSSDGDKGVEVSFPSESVRVLTYRAVDDDMLTTSDATASLKDATVHISKNGHLAVKLPMFAMAVPKAKRDG